MSIFDLRSKYTTSSDQSRVIKELEENFKNNVKYQTLLGVTGSGKTFTMANIIKKLNKPTLIISHNKTLAAQLYNEFSGFYPNNAVEYFISYYDYYQPEAYVPRTDTYIAKDASINDEIDRLKQKTTMSLLTRKDVIVIASVSCIYGLGEKSEYSNLSLNISLHSKITRKELLEKFLELQYLRNDIDFDRGRFRVRGETIDIYPAYMRNIAVRIELFENTVERILLFDPLSGKPIEKKDSVIIFPTTHYATSRKKQIKGINSIKKELQERIEYFKKENKLIEAQRIEERVNFDLEMIEQTGSCSGIENYSIHFSNRNTNDPPSTLIDYFGNDFLTITDESHITIPQLKGMYKGDHSRKKTLVDYGFRLPSALDNRPLKFEELEQRWHQVLFVSATPAEYELRHSKQFVVEQIIRPTGLMDPPIKVRKMDTAIDDLIGYIKKSIDKHYKVLVTTLTKRMAEDLSEYYNNLGLRTKYMHSELNTIERAKIISDLRNDLFDVIIGVNLLREGLDIPEVNLIAVLDADKEGFLRSTTSLIQTAGRSARNVDSLVIFYANRITNSMKEAIVETQKRRIIQRKYNKKHNITPRSIIKSKESKVLEMCNLDYMHIQAETELIIDKKKIPETIKKLKKEMMSAAKKLEFEKAIQIRNEIERLKKIDLEM